jgi:hypothetical protein
MSDSVQCLRCHAQMDRGLVIDGRHEGFAGQQWYRGEAKPSFWMGLKLEKDRIFSVTTWRCPICGYLESYAIPEKTTGHQSL